jgi:hypothetical protein
MTISVARRRFDRLGFWVLLAAGLSSAGLQPLRADEAPKPDPAGIATGDKTTAVDAGGTSFTVAAPTDKNSPDYNKNKKDYEDY